MFWTYILRSKITGCYYIGHTVNLEQRLEDHNLGRAGWTRSQRPWELVYKEFYNTRKAAIKREKYLKSQKNRKFLERMIDMKDSEID
ncbi:MAG: GIY-YIG nuclease family protein [Planctomycetes bacterium]|nr:GIY-YIG nuclease family protein [Planctomycetota bacterium]